MYLVLPHRTSGPSRPLTSTLQYILEQMDVFRSFILQVTSKFIFGRGSLHLVAPVHRNSICSGMNCALTISRHPFALEACQFLRQLATMLTRGLGVGSLWFRLDEMWWSFKMWWSELVGNNLMKCDEMWWNEKFDEVKWWEIIWWNVMKWKILWSDEVMKFDEVMKCDEMMKWWNVMKWWSQNL